MPRPFIIGLLLLVAADTLATIPTERIMATTDSLAFGISAADTARLRSPGHGWSFWTESAANWDDKFVVTGRMRRVQQSDHPSRPWIAVTDGDTLIPLAWPPPFLNMPADHKLAALASSPGRVAVVASSGPGRDQRSRLLVREGDDWQAFPTLRGRITHAVFHDGRWLVGGRFPVNQNASLRVMALVDGRWSPVGTGLPGDDRFGVGGMLVWQGEVVVFCEESRPGTGRLVALRHGQWVPSGPTFAWRKMLLGGLAVWGERLAVFGSFSTVDGKESPGLVFCTNNRGKSATPLTHRWDIDADFAVPHRPMWEIGAAREWNGALLIAHGHPYAIFGGRPNLELLDATRSRPFPGVASSRDFNTGVDDLAVNGDRVAVVMDTRQLLATELGSTRSNLAVWRDGKWHVPDPASLVPRSVVGKANWFARLLYGDTRR